jgi:hypothetical protein
MAPRPKPDHLKIIDGTFRAERAHPEVVPALDGDPVKPKWLTGRGAAIWKEKLSVYRRRGQSVVGCESALAQYCALEASMIDGYRRREKPIASEVNTYRTFAREFYDTPASQLAKAAGSAAPPKNPFLNRDRKPE